MFRLVILFAGFVVLAVAGAHNIIQMQSKPAAAAAKPAPVAEAPRQPAGPAVVALAADARGHFVTDVKINNIFVKGVIDTGATSVAIPLEVAKTIGIEPKASDYTARVQTANGETRAAVVRLAEMRISTIVVRDVEATIVPKGLPVTLVGMSFIRRIKSEMNGNSMVLRQN